MTAPSPERVVEEWSPTCCTGVLRTGTGIIFMGTIVGALHAGGAGQQGHCRKESGAVERRSYMVIVLPNVIRRCPFSTAVPWLR